MKIVGIFFGSDTGNTENIANIIQKQIGQDITKVHDIANSTQEDLESFNILLLGVPTWYYGEVQCDWDDFLPTLKKINFNGKQVALFGCGDQEDYSEYFCDAISVIHDVVKSNGARIAGYWPIAGYHFEASKSIVENKYFLGLTIDEDRQPELSKERITKWVAQISDEFNLQYIIKSKSSSIIT